MPKLLDELNGKWNTLNDTQKKALSNAIAGKTQADVFNSLMNNYDTYQKMMGEFANNQHIGGALRENEKYIDSIDGKINKLKATFTGLASELINTDFVKGGLDGLNMFAEGLTNVVSAISNAGLPAQIAAVAGSVALLTTAFKSFKYADTISDAFLMMRMSIGSFFTSTIPSMVTSIGSAVAAMGSWIALNPLLATGIALVAGAAIAGGVAYKAYVDSLHDGEIALEKAQKSAEKHRKEIDKLDGKEKKVQDLYDKYNELNGVTNKSKEQQKEYNKTLEELAKIDPNLVRYDDSGNPIAVRNGELKDYIRSLQQAQREQQKLLKADLEEANRASRDKYSDNAGNRKSALDALMNEKRKITGYFDAETKQWKSMLLDNDWLEQVASGNEEAVRKANEYFDALRDYKEKEKKFISDMAAQRREVSDTTADLLDNLFGSNKDLENAGKQRQKAMENALKLDFSQFNDSEAKSIANRLNDWIGSASYKDVGEFAKLTDQVQSLNRAWQDGEISSNKYKNSVNDIARQLNELTGSNFTTEEWAKMLKLPEWDVANENNLLNDIENCKNKVQDAINSIAQETDQKQRVKMAMELVQDESIPNQVRDKIAELASDGEITDQELRIILDLLAEVEENDLDETVNKELEGLSDVEKVTKEVAIDFAMKVNNGADFNDYLERLLGDKDLAFDIQVAVSSGDFESLKADLASLPPEKQIGIAVAAFSSGQYTPEQLSGILNALPPEVRSQVIAELEKGNFEQEYEAIINKDGSVTIKIKGENSDAKSKKEEASKDEESKVTIKGENSDAKSKKEEVAKDEQSTVTINAQDNGATETKKEVAKDENSTVNITANDNGATSKKEEIAKDEESTVSIDVQDNGATDTKNKLAEPVNTPVTFQMPMNTQSLLDSVINKNQQVTVSVKAETGSAQSQIKSLTKNQNSTVTVKANTSSAKSAINSIKKPTNSKHTINCTNTKVTSAVNKNKKSTNSKHTINCTNTKVPSAVSKNKKPTKSTHTINCKDNASAKIRSLQGRNTSSTHTIYVKQVGSTKVGGGSSIGDFKNVSNNPFDVENSAEVVSISSVDPKKAVSENQASIASVNEGMGVVGQTFTLETKLDLDFDDVIKAIKEGINVLQELANRISRVTNEIDLLEAKMQNASPEEKIRLLEQQNQLYAEQAKLQGELYNAAQREQRVLGQELSNRGFGVDAQGNLVNYEERLLQLQRTYDDLNKSAENASKAYNDYKGEDEATRNNLQAEADAARDRADAASKELQDAKTLTSQYNTLINDTLPKAELEWQKCQNEIANNNKEIKKLKDEIERAAFDSSISTAGNSIKELNHELEKTNDLLDILDVKMKNAYGQEKLDLMEEQIALMKEQQIMQKDLIRDYQNQANIYKNKLSEYGFTFNGNEITNMDERLNQLQGSEDLEKINQYLKEYMEIMEDGLPKAQLEYEKLNASIIQLNEEKLKATQEIEKKITEMYKKQVDDRIKEINKEKDAQVEALEEQKKAYQDYRKEVEYDNKYKDQVGVITDLEEQIRRLEKDDSLSARKQLAELQKQLEEENKKLQEIVQDQLDKNIEGMYDDAIDNAKTDAESRIDKLEEEFSELNIAKMVQETLASGVFTDIDGNIIDLQTAMLGFIQTSTDGFSVMADSIQNDLITNLNIALDTIKDYQSVMNEMGISQVQDVTSKLPATTTNTINIDAITYNIQSTDPEGVAKEIENSQDDILNKLADGNR